MKKRVGLALGGGGVKGFAHIGVVKALRENKDFLPDIVAGTSAGSIVATLYANGISQEKMEESARNFGWFKDVINLFDSAKMFTKRKLGGLLSNVSLRTAINNLVENKSFDELDIDLAIVTTDIENRRRVIFTSKRVAKIIDKTPLLTFLPAPQESKPGFETLIVSDFNDIGKVVQASCAIPGLFQPVEINGMKLLDGGIIDQVPVDVIKAMRADITIGVSLSLATIHSRIINPVFAASSVLGIMGMHQIRRSLDFADIGFQISGIEGKSSINPKQHELLKLGEIEMKAQIERYLQKVNLQKIK